MAQDNQNTIDYLYDAAGTKLQKVTSSDRAAGLTSDYSGPFVYEDNKLAFIRTSEGRIVPDHDAFAYEYFLKDHLGNTRVVFNEQGEVLQDNSYYPFGGIMEGLNYTAGLVPENKYLYNGKEMQDDFGMDWYDYGARFYDAQLGRWHVIDGHTESYYSWSPYNYVMNNPINMIDWLGLDPVYRNGKYYETDENGEEYEVDWNYVYDWIQKNDGIGAQYSFSTEGGSAKITGIEEGNTGLGFTVNGKDYTANSYMTLMGRDDKNKAVGDFTGIDSWSEDEIIRIMGHGAWVIHDLYNSWVEKAMFGESVGGKLDYKNMAYDILGLNRRSLIEINGVVYNANEAGNFLWGMVLEYHGGLLSPNAIAQIATQKGQNRDDERWEQKAISAGRSYALDLLDRPDLKQRILENRLEFRR